MASSVCVWVHGPLLSSLASTCMVSFYYLFSCSISCSMCFDYNGNFATGIKFSGNQINQHPGHCFSFIQTHVPDFCMFLSVIKCLMESKQWTAVWRLAIIPSRNALLCATGNNAKLMAALSMLLCEYHRCFDIYRITQWFLSQYILCNSLKTVEKRNDLTFNESGYYCMLWRMYFLHIFDNYLYLYFQLPNSKRPGTLRSLWIWLGHKPEESSGCQDREEIQGI